METEAGKRRSPGAMVVLIVFALTLLAASAPYLYGSSVRPAGTRFWAIPVVNYYDANQYLALTRRAAEGQGLLGDPFTAEPHQPRLILPEVQAEGLFCRVFRLSPLGAFHLARVWWGALLLAAAWWLGMLLLPEARQRWLYLALLCTSAGAGWVLERLGWMIRNGDWNQPEANTFHTVANLPHLSLSAALLTTLFASLQALTGDAVTRRRRPLLLLAGGSAFLLAWIHPFDLVTFGLGAGLYGLVRLVQERKLPAPSLRTSLGAPLLCHAAVVIAGALPAAAYLIWLVDSDPVYRALADDRSVVQGFWFYAIAHGPLLLPALAVLCVPKLRRRLLLPLCWVACVFLFLLTPIRMGGKQARLLGGVHAPLALLAAAGVEHLARRGTRRLRTGTRERSAVLLASGYVLLLAPGAAGVVSQQSAWYARGGRDFYLEPDLQELFRRLERENRDGQLTLGGEYTGGWAPVLAGARVYHGHWHMTLDEPQKRAEMTHFFTASQSGKARAKWLRRNGVTWVIRCPWEWNEEAVSLGDVPGLQRVFDTPEGELYRFTSTEGSNGLEMRISH